MEPYKAKLLPINYKLSKEMVMLLSEANEKYGNYKALLNMFEFDQKYFLNSLILGESVRSSRIEGTQISQDDMYYIDYKENNDSLEEVKNLKKMLEYADQELYNKSFNLELINSMHKILLSNVRGRDKNPGEIRRKQNYIGLKGLGKEGATFIPPVFEEVPFLLENLFEYMNNPFIDEPFINTAISHVQFESIHPYLDGNGRMGRALITLQLAKLKEDKPILFLSEIIEIYKSNYYNELTECRRGNIEGFINFFLKCVIDQCTRNINRIESINKTYKEDKEKIQNNIGGGLILKIHPFMMKKIVFTIKDIENEFNIHPNSITRLLKKLIDLDIISKEKRAGTNKITYKYKRIYEVFVEQI